MPYVPSRKTDGVSDDREILDAAVERLATGAARRITNNLSLIRVYINTFISLSDELYWKLRDHPLNEGSGQPSELARTIVDVSAKYDYEGAYLGELNYAVTRFIQRVPQIKVREGVWDCELRYWIYAATVEALTFAAQQSAARHSIGIGGVFEDVKDEYKRRVNTAYEAAQILKSGDCYDTPYYTRLIEVVDENGTLIGHQEVMLKRSDDSLYHDLLDFQIVARRR